MSLCYQGGVGGWDRHRAAGTLGWFGKRQHQHFGPGRCKGWVLLGHCEQRAGMFATTWVISAGEATDWRARDHAASRCHLANVNLSGIESSDVMAKDFSRLISMTCPFRVNLIGTIHEIDDEVKFTRDDIGQKNVILHDASGFGVKLLCHGYWCEEPMERGQRWAICFGECRESRWSSDLDLRFGLSSTSWPGWTPGVSWGACMLLLLPLLLLRWCCRLPKRTPRHTETPCYWRTERPPKNMLPRGLTSLLDSDKNKASSAAVPAAGPAAAAAAAALVLQASKRTPRHTETPCYWRTERPPKNMLPRGLTSLLDSDKNKASSAPGPAAAAGPAAAGGGGGGGRGAATAAGAGAAGLPDGKTPWLKPIEKDEFSYFFLLLLLLLLLLLPLLFKRQLQK